MLSVILPVYHTALSAWRSGVKGLEQLIPSPKQQSFLAVEVVKCGGLFESLTWCLTCYEKVECYILNPWFLGERGILSPSLDGYSQATFFSSYQQADNDVL